DRAPGPGGTPAPLRSLARPRVGMLEVLSARRLSSGLAWPVAASGGRRSVARHAGAPSGRGAHHGADSSRPPRPSPWRMGPEDERGGRAMRVVAKAARQPPAKSFSGFAAEHSWLLGARRRARPSLVLVLACGVACGGRIPVPATGAAGACVKTRMPERSRYT